MSLNVSFCKIDLNIIIEVILGEVIYYDYLKDKQSIIYVEEDFITCPD